MVLHVLIVDDEIHICRLLSKFVRDLYPDAEIVTAHTGTRAYEIICEMRPDIVITDIRIPEMDGIELVRRCWEEGLPSRFIIISGYRKFEYAHNALKYGVVNYLLKPIQVEEFHAVLKNTEQAILDENALHENHAMMQDQIVAYRQQIRRKILSDLLEGRSDADVSSFAGGMYTAVVTKLSIRQAMRGNVVFRRMITDNLKSICGAFFSSGSETAADVLSYRDSILFLVHAEAGGDPAEEIRGLVTAVIRWTVQYSEFKVSIGISHSFSDILKLREETETAWRCAFAHLEYGFGRDFRAESFDNAVLLSPGEIRRLRREFRRQLEGGDPMKTRSWLSQEFLRVSAQPDRHPFALYELYTELMDEMNAYIESLALPSLKKVQPSDDNLLADSVPSFIHITLNEIAGQIRLIEEQKRSVDEMPVALAKQYIQSHIREDISLETVAEKVHLSHTYFSMLFKKETGRNFIDYVIWARMEEAKRLLAESQMPVSDIAEAVGYLDIRSFSKRFKKEVGITPSHFRKYHLDSQIDWWMQ